MNYKKNSLNDNIYFSDSYIDLYIKEGECLFEFKVQDGDKIFLNKSIKRPIRKVGAINLEKDYFDLETAYGYGGFYINTDDERFIQSAFDSYRKRCRQECIIAEFVRFNPFNNFPQKHSDLCDFSLNDRSIVCVNLDQSYEKIRSEYSKTLRNDLNRARRNGLVLQVHDYSDATVTAFYDLYCKTMVKNKAEFFYYFSREYFDSIIQLDGVRLYAVSYENKCICMVLILKERNVAYYHLAATDPDFYNLNPSKFILDEIIQDLQPCCSRFMMGGGTTSSEDDSLLRFKKKFSPLLMPFYISGIIYDLETYDFLNSLWSKQAKSDVNYFLKYRVDL